MFRKERVGSRGRRGNASRFTIDSSPRETYISRPTILPFPFTSKDNVYKLYYSSLLFLPIPSFFQLIVTLLASDLTSLHIGKFIFALTPKPTGFTINREFISTVNHVVDRATCSPRPGREERKKERKSVARFECYEDADG